MTHVGCVRMQLFVGAMGPPGGGRNDISSRFMRHLQIISIDEFDENTMLRIFYAITEWHFSKGYDSVFIRMGKVRRHSGHPHRRDKKGKGLGTCYSAAYMSRLEQQRFTVSEGAADWYELIIPWRIMRPSRKTWKNKGISHWSRKIQ